MEQQTIALAHGNVGAARGDFRWPIKQPGLYLYVGPRGTGKTTLTERVLRLLSAAPEDINSRFPISHGADSGYIELTPRYVGVSRTITGVPREAVISGAEVKVEGPPQSILTLITGNGLKGAVPRALSRLEALFSYSPVSSSEERLDALLSCLLEYVPGQMPRPRAFAEIPQSLREAWRELALSSGKLTEKKYHPLRSPAEIRSWLQTLGTKRKGTVLDDHGLLFGKTGLANGIINTGRHALAEQDRRRAKIEGKAEEILRQARGDLDAARQELEAEHNLPVLIAAEATARERAESARRERGRHEAEVERRDRLREALAPERPEVDAARRDEVAAQIEPAEKALVTTATDLDAVRRQYQAAEITRNAAGTGADEAIEDMEAWWVDAKIRIREQSPCGGEEARLGSDLGAREGARLLERLATALAFDTGTADRLRQDVEEAIRVKDDASETRDRLRSDFRSAQEDIDRQERDQRRWDEITAELDADLPEVAELAVAEVAAEAAARAVRVAETAAAYQAAAAELKAALEMSATIDQMVKAYGNAKKDSWVALGQVVTGALPARLQNFVQVDGTRLFIGYKDGKLNRDSQALAAAREAARKALEAAIDPTSPIAGGRFLERVREHSDAIEWRDADSNEWTTEDGEPLPSWEQSECELTLAMTEIWLERQDLGTIRTMPTTMTHPFDGEAFRETSRRCAEKKMLVFGARPATDRDPQRLHLVYVDPEAGEHVIERETAESEGGAA